MRKRTEQEIENRIVELFTEISRRILDEEDHEVDDLVDEVKERAVELEFQQGQGQLITLRIHPPPWMDSDVSTWNWKELLDIDTVEFVGKAQKEGDT